MDRISGLSDELLIKILLLVPTKVAVSTSILSKRWEYLWMWLPKLEYGHRYCSEPESKRLQCFLNRNLPLHRAPVIESFRLELRHSRFKLESFNMWVVIALSHCLRELDIFFESHPAPANPIILPSNLFTCKSLAILKLDGDFILDVPRMVSLPSLKTLKLQCVRFTNDETLQRLLSSCPVLEDLLVDLGDRDITTRKFSVVVPSLLSLTLVMLYTHGMDGFVIDTPALKCFELVDSNCNDYYCLLEHMPNLIEAHFDVSLLDIKSLIGSITSVKRLTICSKAMLDEGFVFNQLEHLKLCLCSEHSLNKLVRLLKLSPNLQGLHLFYMDEHDGRKLVYWNQPTTVPECISSSLESLSWSFYSGEPEERDIVVYILKHALHLKTVTIKSSSESDFTQLKMLQELALSSRASAACQLKFR
ncbi:FBD domain-containing protein [Hirschfeldia incana]|nr:FBD domain-containing protein [Hirschfeldia incana]KAJ0246970.1 FBD domain-containing protein [Hirschfeldia incana]